MYWSQTESSKWSLNCVSTRPGPPPYTVSRMERGWHVCECKKRWVLGENMPGPLGERDCGLGSSPCVKSRRPDQSLARCTLTPLWTRGHWAVSFQAFCESATRTTHNSAQPRLSPSQTISTSHTPDADGLVVASRRHHIRVARVPRNSVNAARMARKHLRAPWTRLSGLYLH